LAWDGSTGAQAYNIYRDGKKIGSTNGTTSFRDPNVPAGAHSYDVSASNSSGEGASSKTVSVWIASSTLSFRHSGVIQLVWF